MLTENLIITATDKILLEKNKNKFKRQLNEQKTAHLLPQCSVPDFDKRHLQTSSEGSDGEMLFALLPDGIWSQSLLIMVLSDNTAFIAHNIASQTFYQEVLSELIYY